MHHGALRRYLDKLLAQPGAEFSLVVAEIRSFDLLQETHGRACCAELVRRVTGRLTLGVDPPDVVAYLGSGPLRLVDRAGQRPRPAAPPETVRGAARRHRRPAGLRVGQDRRRARRRPLRVRGGCGSRRGHRRRPGRRRARRKPGVRHGHASAAHGGSAPRAEPAAGARRRSPAPGLPADRRARQRPARRVRVASALVQLGRPRLARTPSSPSPSKAA